MKTAAYAMFDAFVFRFVRGVKPGRQTGFDIDDSNLLEMDSCRGVVVASAIFGTIYPCLLHFGIYIFLLLTRNCICFQVPLIIYDNQRISVNMPKEMFAFICLWM